MIAAHKTMSNNDDDTDVPERMAEAIVQIIQLRGKCSVLDLKTKGFSLDEIARYWPEASEIAEEITKSQLPCLPKN